MRMKGGATREHVHWGWYGWLEAQDEENRDEDAASGSISTGKDSVVAEEVKPNRYQQRAFCLWHMADFLLNCFVLGDDDERVFPVKIQRNDNVGILKDKIKKKKSHLLSDIDASDLDLWKVCSPIDDPTSKRPQAERPLRDNKRLSSLWDGDPSDDDLHILVKAPSTSWESWFLISTDIFISNPQSWSNPPPLAQLLCSRWQHSTFTVKIPRNDSVSILKKLIKEKSPDLDHVAASKLNLAQVPLAFDEELEENVKKIDLVPLMPLLQLSQVFSRVEENRLHIIVQAPAKGRPISALLYIVDGLIYVFRWFDYQRLRRRHEKRSDQWFASKCAQLFPPSLTFMNTT